MKNKGILTIIILIVTTSNDGEGNKNFKNTHNNKLITNINCSNYLNSVNNSISQSFVPIRPH